MDKEKIEQLIEEKVEERVQEELAKREVNTDKQINAEEKEEKVSRRDFLKKLGVGAVGLGALSLPSASALNLRSNNLQFYGGDGETDVEFEVDSNGNITASNTLDMSDNKITGLKNPSNPQDAATYNWVNKNYNNYTDSDAIDAINNDSDHGSTASHNYFSGNYGDLSNIPSTFTPENHGNTKHSTNYLPESDYKPETDTHSKYTDNNAVSAGQDAGFTDMGDWGTNGSRELTVHGQRALVGFDGGRLAIGFDGDFTQTDIESGPLNINGNRVLTTADEGSGNGLNADKVDNIDSTGFARKYDGVQVPVYASLSDVPSGINKGEIIYNDNDGSIYVEDGT